ncbi:MAG: adenylate/guanylate cyclase domain-containing protein [Pseudomonadota bacterium]
MLLHPVFGALDISWEAQTDKLSEGIAPRSAMQSPDFQNSPYFRAAEGGIPFQRFKLDGPIPEDEFPILGRLRSAGVTEYTVFYRDYGRRNIELWAGLPQGLEGAVGSFSTRRIGGFSDTEIEDLSALATPLSLVVKARTSRELTKTLIDTYLGKHSGDHVLNGLIGRGDGQPIECVVWYCDLRGSTRLAEELSMDQYLEMLDAYFDCTAGAVLDHGGEVLKFIGDAVMAIFPIEDGRPAIDMCRAALSAATEALRKAELINEERELGDLPSIRFGIALHIGEVLYGNVGTDRRLDFTVIGPAANEANRVEQLCKSLQTPVIASEKFAESYSGKLVDLGSHKLAGVKAESRAFTVPEFAPAS